jgi:hypothetical protein
LYGRMASLPVDQKRQKQTSAHLSVLSFAAVFLLLAGYLLRTNSSACLRA